LHFLFERVSQIGVDPAEGEGETAPLEIFRMLLLLEDGEGDTAPLEIFRILFLLEEGEGDKAPLEMSRTLAFSVGGDTAPTESSTRLAGDTAPFEIVASPAAKEK